MPQSSQHTMVVRQRQAPRDVTLRCWPLFDRPWLPRGVLAGSLLLAWLAGALAGSSATGVFFAACVLLALWQIWLPVRYELGPQGITQFSLARQRRIPWSTIGRIERRAGGILVLRDPQPAPLDALRGLYLPYGNQKPELLAIVEFYLAGRAS